jgi:hypothetical protein
MEEKTIAVLALRANCQPKKTMLSWIHGSGAKCTKIKIIFGFDD